MEKVALLSDIAINNGSVSKLYSPSVLIELSSTCNLSCGLCPAAQDNRILDRANKMIKKEDFERIVELTEPFTRTYILNMWGEPLLNPHFFEYWQKVSHKESWVSSNLNMSEETAKKLAKCTGLNVICSVDNIGKESYENGYRRGGNFDVVCRALKILAAGTCIARPQFLIHDGNRDQKQDMIDFVKSMGIDETRIIFKDKIEELKNQKTTRSDGVCHYLYQGYFFNSDGYLVPCCMNTNRDVFIAHINSFESSEDLRNGGGVRKFRKQLAKDKTVFPSCKNCTETLNYPNEIKKGILNRFRKYTVINKSARIQP